MKLSYIDYDGRGHYATVTDGSHFANIEKDHFHGYNVSTVHIANRKTGTGFRIAERVDSEKAMEALRVALLTDTPFWAPESDRKSVKKFASIDAILEKERKFWKDAHVVENFTLEVL